MGITNYVKGQTLHVGGTAGDDPDAAQIDTNTTNIAANLVLIGTPDGVSNAADIAANLVLIGSPNGASNAADIAANVVTLATKATIGTLAGFRVPTVNDILVLTDVGKAVEMNNASARTITVPPNTDVAFPLGTVIRVTRFGAGTTAIVAGAGVTVNSAESFLHLADQFSSAILYQREADDWVLSGDLSVAGA